MWKDDALHKQMLEDHTIATGARVLAEFNVNSTAKLKEMGVYKSNDGSSPDRTWQEGDKLYVYTVETPEKDDIQLLDTTPNLLEKYFSLADCFKFRRPRGGIIYTQYPGQRNKVYIEDYSTAYRPRYYIVGKNMEFKYWNSAVLSNIDADAQFSGVSSTVFSKELGGYLINNVIPFVVYDSIQYANKIVVKMQTYNGKRRYTNDPVADTWRVPVKWAIEYLGEDSIWHTVKEFTEASRPIQTDGQVELMYGPVAPIGFTETFRLYGSVEYPYELDEIPLEYRHDGMAFKHFDELRVWSSTANGVGAWTHQDLKYEWDYSDAQLFQPAITDIVNPSADPERAEFVALRGIRIVVSSMSAPETPFELIELSPRLQINITQYVSSFDLNKSLGLSDQLPFGELSNDMGSIELLNYDGAFSTQNKYNRTSGKGSLISEYMNENTKFIFFNEIRDPILKTIKYVQLKTMYIERWPLNDPASGELHIDMRDYFMFFEQIKAPDLFFQNISLTYVMSVLMDNIGFSNYVFLGFDQTNDLLIPYFFCNNTSNLLDVLNDLIKAARCAMYFDEYNNFVMVSKEYLSGMGRAADSVLYGQSTDDILANIEGMALDRRQLFNDGTITFSPKYISKGLKSHESAYFIGKNRRFGYQPTKLWELATDTTTTYTSPTQNSQDFALSAVILAKPLTTMPPIYNPATNTFTNNIIDIGTSVYFLNRFAGYLYANGEIIRYDAVEFNIGGVGKVWISYNDQFVHYANNIGFNQFIEKTGRIRIWTEVINGVLEHHGRGYFDTPYATHATVAGTTWTGNGGWDAMEMEYVPLFSPCAVVSFLNYNIHPDPKIRWSTTNKGTPGARAPKPTFVTKGSLDASGEKITMQISAMNWKGPSQDVVKNNRTVNYFRKKFPNGKNYTRFGTRLRIIGEPMTGSEDQQQQPESNISLIEAITGKKFTGSDCSAGGLSLFTDGRHQGYFLEVIAFGNNVASTDIKCGDSQQEFHQIIFYKVMSVTDAAGKQLSMPFKLWGGHLPVALDSGNFASEDRADNDTFNVIDLEVEVYRDTFDIYANGIKLGTATDDVNSMILLHQKYFEGRESEFVNNDPYKNIIKSIPVLGTASKEYGVFVRGDSRIMFENVWAVQKSSAVTATSNAVPRVFGEVEVDNAYGRASLDNIGRRHRLSGFIQHEQLTNFVNNGYRYSIDYEEFGTILRECYPINARYTEAFPTFYARILPGMASANPVAISNELVGQYDTEFMLFNVADKGVVLEGSEDGINITGIVLTGESTMDITVDQYIERRKSETNQLKNVKQLVDESRRRFGTAAFVIDSSTYLQSITQAESILNWALRYLIEEKLWATADVFANPMLQLGDILVMDQVSDKLMRPGVRMMIDEIGYSYDQQGPKMTLQLREVL